MRKLCISGDITGASVAYTEDADGPLITRRRRRYADINNPRHSSFFGIKPYEYPVAFVTAPILALPSLEIAHEVVRVAFTLEEHGGVPHSTAVRRAVDLVNEAWLEHDIEARTLVIDSIAALERD